MLSVRQKELHDRLISEHDFLLLGTIKEAYQLLSRTIQQDLLVIEECLLEIGRNRQLRTRFVVQGNKSRIC
ncbi:hypothetical protein [Alkalicoccobacillus murimartini]|uniref:Transcriptional antiterminator n=1 Tax=Alkalicoccobacillus murimartini TaxID=171685 RepID=A0ABT9YGD7_9BACI|nr:hypothetical protein [Alkalicoccobacillus murimartini]MDQ0206929.1 transcriptional antiterminator [Alkalicoccobacillus murimartini]